MKRSTPEEPSSLSTEQQNNLHRIEKNNQNKRVKRSHHYQNVPIFDNFVSMLKSIPMVDEQQQQDTCSSMELASPSSLKYKSSSLIQQQTKPVHPFYNILSFLDFDELIHSVALVSKITHYAVRHSVEHLTLDSESANFSNLDDQLSEDEQQNHNMTIMIDIVNRFPSLKVLSVDGLDFFNDVCLSKLVENLPPHLSEIHIRECPLDSPIILDKKSMNSESFSQSSDSEYIPSIQQLKVLRFSSIKFTSFEVGYLKNLLSLEFYDSSFEKYLRISQCSKLDRLICFKCTGLTDTMLLATLKVFLQEEVAHLQPNSNTNSQTEEEPEGRPATNDDDSIFDTARNVKNRKYGSLKKLYLTECEPLTNPVIQSNTIEEIKVIDCKYLKKPFISCPALSKLQLNWCENLKSLNLACDNLKFIDLTGAGVTYSNSQGSNSQGSATNRNENTILHNVIGGLRKHYGEQLKIAL